MYTMQLLQNVQNVLMLS
jgi:hypothetical protein